MAIYQAETTCAKCGSGFVGTSYIIDLDVMLRTCKNCGFHWNEAPLDSKDSPKLPPKGNNEKEKE